MPAYYNEIDAYAAQWLRNLIAAGHIAPGDVDTRSIAEVSPDDLRSYTQCHFFAGIGGWSYALRLAGWGDARPVWTGSCPCQPFSAAGKRKAGTDARHLWPVWFRLIAECQPHRVFGEQVEGAVGLGWLDRVFADMEGQDYACGAAVLGAHSVGSPNIRQRLFWVADSGCGSVRDRGYPLAGEASGVQGEAWEQRLRPNARHGGAAGGMADSADGGRQHEPHERPAGVFTKDAGAPDGRNEPGLGRPSIHRLAHTAHTDGRPGECGTEAGTRADEQRRRGFGERGEIGFWSDADWLPCTDGKARRVEPGTFPLAHGIPNRVGRLRAYGNAINPHVAAEFIRAAA